MFRGFIDPLQVALRVFLTVVAAIVVFILLYPILYVVIASLLVGETLAISIEAIRTGLTVDRYVETLSDPDFIKGVMVSLVVAFLHILFSVFLITPAAYAFSRFKFRGKDFILILYLILSQVGGGFGIAALIALYIVLVKLNAIGLPVIGNPVILALIYTAWAVPFQTWLIKNYFDSLPRELDEAAFIDGASWSTIVFKVILPASRPAMTVIALFSFMGAWGEFIVASFIKVPTVAAYIYQTAVGQTIFWGDFAARTILFSIPIVLLFIISQRYIGEAVRYGAGKL